MDLFRFLEAPDSPFKIGFLVEGAESITWIERYREPGEFTVVAPVHTAMQSQLPLGSMVSLVNSKEVMVVENHAISDDEDGGVNIIVTGRSLEVRFEDRVVGSNFSGTRTTLQPPLVLPSDVTPTQAVSLINKHILASEVFDDDDALPNTEAVVGGVSGGVATSREVQQGNLHERLMEILAVDDLGIKTWRPSADSPFSAPRNETDTAFIIHNGVDRSQQVAFSYDDGDLESADYLWSTRTEKTAALVLSTWAQVRVDTGKVGFDRRFMIVDASDIDEDYQDAPLGAELIAIQNKLEVRGYDAIYANRPSTIVSVQPASNSTDNVYRQDYNIGDIVAVEGNYNSETTMRVIEHVEIEDDQGGTSYPTFALHY